MPGKPRPMKQNPFSGLRSVGPATRRDFALLGIHTTDDLAAADPAELYQRLCRLTGVTVDICQYDVFRCAVAQARDPDLADEQRDWFWWSRQRKASAIKANEPA